MANSNITSRTQQTDRSSRAIVEADRAAVQAKTARLRALRLAKEAAEAIALPAATPPAPRKAAKRRASA